MNILDRCQAASAPYIRMMRLKQQTIGTLIFTIGAIDAQNFVLTPLLLAFCGIVLSSVAGFMINDFFDSADTDKFSYRKRIRQTEVQGKIVLTLWTLFNLAAFIILINLGLVYTSIILFLANTTYSAPPLRFKAHFPMDLVVTFLWGVIGYSVPFLLMHKNLSDALITMPFASLCIFIGSGVFLLAIMDTESDSLAKLKNLGPVVGYKWLVRITKVCLIGSGAFIGALIYNHSNWWYYPFLFAIPYFGYALGRLREAVYLPKELKNSTLNLSFTRAVTAMGLIALYLGFVYIYGYLKFNRFI